MMNVNFIFIRHGESCQNLIFKKIHDKKLRKEYFKEYYDPTLSEMGLEDSIKMGKLLKKYLKDNFDIKSYDFVISSPLIRAIETAYFMTLQKVNVYPYLREISKMHHNEDKTDMYHPLKSIKEQEEYFKKIGINNEVNFLDKKSRRKPGDIEKFLDFFIKNNNSSKPLNVIIFCHSKIMKYFTGESYKNNTGFILKMENGIFNKFISLKSWENNYKRTTFKCSLNRCKKIYNN